MALKYATMRKFNKLFHCLLLFFYIAFCLSIYIYLLQIFIVHINLNVYYRLMYLSINISMLIVVSLFLIAVLSSDFIFILSFKCLLLVLYYIIILFSWKNLGEQFFFFRKIKLFNRNWSFRYFLVVVAILLRICYNYFLMGLPFLLLLLL